MNLTPIDIFLVLATIAALLWSIVQLVATVIPLQIKEARVVNGLAKLRKQLLRSGVSITVACSIAVIILLLWLFGIRSRLLTEALLLVFAMSFVVISQTKHAIYHQQYTPEHKELSRRMQEEMEQEERAEHESGL